MNTPPTRALPPYSPLAAHFPIDQSVVFLNHGSFGCTPRSVSQFQNDLLARVDREPVRFFIEDLEGLMDEARRHVAAFVGCPADDLAFVTNATEGVNTIVRSLAFRPGDELLTSTHEYNACNNALHDAATRSGAAVTSLRLPCPVQSDQQIIDAVMQAITPRTRLLLLSHITSPSGVILPVAPIIQAAQAKGVDVLLDSAHAPGFLPFNISALAPAYCTANLHKWTCAPKGAAILYVRPDRQHLIKPLIISHGDNSTRTDRTRFRLNFDFTGSRDYSPWLAAPAAIDLVGGLAGGGGSRGWPAVIAANTALAKAGSDTIIKRLVKWNPTTLAPDHMLGAMRAITLPTPSGGPKGPTRYYDPLQDRLIAKHYIQVPIHTVTLTDGTKQRVVRISAMLYNTLPQYEYLAHALATELSA